VQKEKKSINIARRWHSWEIFQIDAMQMYPAAQYFKISRRIFYETFLIQARAASDEIEWLRNTGLWPAVGNMFSIAINPHTISPDPLSSKQHKTLSNALENCVCARSEL
jgi:hypothetical protein